MAVPTAYFTSAKNVRAILESTQKGGVPSRVTYDFLKQLGYPSSSDRPVLAVMKALGFLTESGEPTGRYRRYKDPRTAAAVMAEALRDAYADVFTVDQAAFNRSTNELRGIFARLSDKGNAVNLKMATTFKTLAELADFDAVPEMEPVTGSEGVVDAPAVTPLGDSPGIRLHHDVHVHLPLSTDIAVYDAIFRSLRENLMR